MTERNTADGVIVGIDLGTTFSLVAILQDGKPIVLPNAIGERMTPSAVSFEKDGHVLVGAAARARAATHPELTALAFKRDMGSEKRIACGGRSVTPQELSALVLQGLKQDAEDVLGMPVIEAVVTVPAYFGDAQRQATRDAAAIAGLHVERIINEPTAAAMAYGLHNSDKEMRAIVLDLGGGTFDVTVLEIIEGVIEIQSTAGDARLGGEDCVDAMAAELGERIKTQHNVEAKPGGTSFARIREACEEAKQRLSSVESTHVVVPALVVDEQTIDIDFVFTRDECETLWAPILGRMQKSITRALRDAKVRADEIEEVLLVGGATRMPCVVRLATKIFSRLPLRGLPADEAVVMGAAVQAALKSGDKAVSDLIVTDVAPFTLGIESATLMGRQQVSGLFSPIIERGTTIPASRSEHFHTLSDQQRSIQVSVYQGEHAMCKDNTFLGEYLVKNLPRDKAGQVSIEVRFTYDLNGILEVEMLSEGRKEHLVIESSPGRLSKKEIQAARKAMERYKFHPRDSLPNRTALARADALYVELTGFARDELGQSMAQFRAVLDSQDTAVIDDMRQHLNALISSQGRPGPAA